MILTENKDKDNYIYFYKIVIIVISPFFYATRVILHYLVGMVTIGIPSHFQVAKYIAYYKLFTI